MLRLALAVVRVDIRALANVTWICVAKVTNTTAELIRPVGTWVPYARRATFTLRQAGQAKVQGFSVQTHAGPQQVAQPGHIRLVGR